MLIVGSAAEPYLKPNLIDRFLVSAKRTIRPLIVINKVDLLDRAMLAPIVGVYSQMGYRVMLVSARGPVSASIGFAVRSPVAPRPSPAKRRGVSSLLNAVEPGFALPWPKSAKRRKRDVTRRRRVGLLPLATGGYVVDTPGIRQFQLWDVVREEIAGYYRDLRPLVSKCRFPDCTHTHEADFAVKDAVADGWLDARRYESYCHLFAGDMDG